jgi:DNA polymerase-3 subunit beta
MASVAEIPTTEKVATKLEIVVNRETLLAELAFAQSVTNSKNALPILSNILIEANDTSLTIIATNLDQSIQTSVPAKVKTPGVVTLPARKFFDYVRLLQTGDLSLKQLDNNWVQIRSGRSNTKMVGMGRSNFPQVPGVGAAQRFKIPVSTLSVLIGQTSFAASREESRYTLMASLFAVSPDKVMMVATDGHRLALVDKSEKVEGVDKVFSHLIPLRALDDLQSLLGSTDEPFVEFSDDDTTLFFNFGHRKYSTRKQTGNFPNFKAVIPTGNDKVVIVGTADLDKSIRRVAQFADDRSNTVKLTLKDSTLKISSSSSENGESEEVIETPYTKEPFSIGFNATYILDFLKAIGGKGEVRMEFKDGNSGAIFKPEAAGLDHTLTYIVMPCRH